ncbi:TPA: hypothetical protein ACH3X1_016168 [Trebouxia sp. C0004]
MQSVSSTVFCQLGYSAKSQLNSQLVTAAEQYKSLQTELEAAAKVAVGQEQAATAKLHAELRTLRSNLSAAQQAAAGWKEEAEQQQQNCSHSWTLHSSKRQLRGRSWTHPKGMPKAPDSAAGDSEQG